MARPSIHKFNLTTAILFNFSTEGIVPRALLLGKKGEYSVAIPSEQLGDADPEYLIVAPCGFNLQRSLRAQGVLERHPWWRDLQAVTATLRLRTVISSLIVPE